MNLHKFALGASAAILIGAMAQPGRADAITDVSGSVFAALQGNTSSFCQLGSPCALGPASATASVISPPDPDSDYSGSAGATVSGTPAPGVIASAAATAYPVDPSAAPDAPVNFQADAILNYYFELTQTGGSYSGAVPVTMTGSSSISQTVSLDQDDYTMGSVMVIVGTADGVTTLLNLPSNNNTGFSSGLSLMPNVLYEVQLAAYVDTEVDAVDETEKSLSMTASVDPMFTIDPDYASDFSLSFSDGIGNSAASTAPEPASAMLVAAAGGILLLRRLKSRS